MNVAVRPVHGLALCAGGAGLELGVRLALGARYRTVAHVERDPFAAAVLVARMADEALDPAPVWDDLCTFDGRPWRGVVDLVTAGFPCQPFSAAGQRRGLDDDRWLWPHVARVVREVGPRFVFVENVRGFLAEHGGLGAVLGDLADLGFDAEWEVLSAQEVGATHRRERFWLLAYRDDLGREGFGWQPGHEPGRAPVADTVGEQRERGRGPVDMVGSSGRAQGEARQRERRRDASGDRREAVAARPQGRGVRRRGRADERSAGTAVGPLGLWPPGPDDTDGWTAVLEHDPSVEPAVHRMADGLACRVERSHLIGNGVVPLVAGAALLRLAGRAGFIRGESPVTATPATIEEAASA